jgi:predicted amidohydrolase
MWCGVVQMNSQKDVNTNLRVAEQLIKQASEQKARLVVLPEMFASLGMVGQHELAVSRFTPKDVLATLAAWSKQFQVFLVAGSVPIVSDSDAKKVHATSLVFSPKGVQLAAYEKIHLFDVLVSDEKGSYKESDTFLPGSTAQSVDIDNIKLGLTICYDLRFPELFQQYMKQGCQVISVPSAFTYQTGKVHWEILLRARAIETQSYILAANQVGVHEDGRRTWGHSMIVSPTGEVLAEVTQASAGLAMAEIDLNRLQKCRDNMPLIKHKRLI